MYGMQGSAAVDMAIRAGSDTASAFAAARGMDVRRASRRSPAGRTGATAGAHRRRRFRPVAALVSALR